MAPPRQSALEAVAKAARKVENARGVQLMKRVEDLCKAVAALDALGPADADDGWRDIDEFREHEVRIYVTDGTRAAVVYLSKWSSLWYFDCNQKGCNWRLTHYQRISLPTPPQLAQEGEG